MNSLRTKLESDLAKGNWYARSISLSLVNDRDIKTQLEERYLVLKKYLLALLFNNNKSAISINDTIYTVTTNVVGLNVHQTKTVKVHELNGERLNYLKSIVANSEVRSTIEEMLYLLHLFILDTRHTIDTIFVSCEATQAAVNSIDLDCVSNDVLALEQVRSTLNRDLVFLDLYTVNTLLRRKRLNAGI